MRSVRFNEKVKRLSTLVGAGGIALVISAVTRWLDRAPEPFELIWISVGLAFIFVSVQMNDLLQSEDE